jgi:hypothetical protein
MQCNKMLDKILRYAAYGACVLALACGSVYAQDPKVAHTTAAPKSSNVPAPPLPPATVKLFSNLGPAATDDYSDTGGNFVLGADNSLGHSEQWIATPFTVTKSGYTIVATEIEAAIGAYATGSGGTFTLAIYNNDASTNAPMTSLGSGTATATASYSTCCSLAHATLRQSVTLTSGTQYWIVATSDDSTNPDFTAVWDDNNDYPLSVNTDQDGWSTFLENVPAVEMLGTETAD